MAHNTYVFHGVKKNLFTPHLLFWNSYPDKQFGKSKICILLCTFELLLIKLFHGICYLLFGFYFWTNILIQPAKDVFLQWCLLQGICVCVCLCPSHLPCWEKRMKVNKSQIHFARTSVFLSFLYLHSSWCVAGILNNLLAKMYHLWQYKWVWNGKTPFLFRKRGT